MIRLIPLIFLAACGSKPAEVSRPYGETEACRDPERASSPAYVCACWPDQRPEYVEAFGRKVKTEEFCDE